MTNRWRSLGNNKKYPEQKCQFTDYECLYFKSSSFCLGLPSLLSFRRFRNYDAVKVDVMHIPLIFHLRPELLTCLSYLASWLQRQFLLTMKRQLMASASIIFFFN